MSFSYLIDKIRDAEFETEPFRHIHLRNFLTRAHFEAVIAAPEIATETFGSDAELFDGLFSRGYKAIDFPGCIPDYKEYIRWHARREGRVHNYSSCEGFGVTLRLMRPVSPIIEELSGFLASEAFQSALAGKFGIDLSAVYYDAGIQKYLDGYEISPHPDTRKKALTYMVNVNPRSDSESCDHHTHYLRFTPERRYVQALWENNPDVDRCWVPWDWCETVKTQPENNSVVIFAPTDDTVHAVKASYDHLKGQRTQLYGNLWFREVDLAVKPEWEDLDFAAHARKRDPTTRSRIPAPLRAVARRIKRHLRPEDGNIVMDRRSAK